MRTLKAPGNCLCLWGQQRLALDSDGTQKSFQFIKQTPRVVQFISQLLFIQAGLVIGQVVGIRGHIAELDPLCLCDLIPRSVAQMQRMTVSAT